jgi:hypothetical protein
MNLFMNLIHRAFPLWIRLWIQFIGDSPYEFGYEFDSSGSSLMNLFMNSIHRAFPYGFAYEFDSYGISLMNLLMHLIPRAFAKRICL